MCSNDVPGLTTIPNFVPYAFGSLCYFTATPNSVPYAFVWGKNKTMDFSESIVVYDIKVGRCSYLNEYMNLYEFQSSKLFIDLGPWSFRFNIFKLLLVKNC